MVEFVAKAEKTGKGLHDKKNIPTHRVSDMSGNALKCKQFLPFLQRAGRMSGMVEFVASGSRFRVYIPRETCVITFLLGGIDCAKSGRTMPSGDVIKGDTYGDECAAHAACAGGRRRMKMWCWQGQHSIAIYLSLVLGMLSSQALPPQIGLLQVSWQLWKIENTLLLNFWFLLHCPQAHAGPASGSRLLFGRTLATRYWRWSWRRRL